MQDLIRRVFAVCIAGMLALAPSAWAELVLWNTLGSRAEIENSVIGLDGTYSGGGFMPGVSGYAYTSDTIGSQAFFPNDAIPVSAGAIEFWGKLTGVQPYMPYDWGPFFINCEDPGVTGYRLAFECNDGNGGGGMCGGAGDGPSTSTGVWGWIGSWSWEEVLGAGQVEAWHHYALVWDKNGIFGVEDGTKQVALFLDGLLHSGRWYQPPAEFPPLAGGPLELIGLRHLIQDTGTLAIDEIKIWDYAKTDYSGTQPLPVAFDLRPMLCPNYFSEHLIYILPAAILGAANLNVGNIDFSSLMLILPEGSVAPDLHYVLDVATPVEDPEWCECHVAGPDGHGDLALTFDAHAIIEALGPAHDGDLIQACIAGAMNDGTPIVGCDCLSICGSIATQPISWGSLKALY